MKRFVLGFALAFGLLLLVIAGHVLKKRQPVLIYQVDSDSHGVLGRVSDKTELAGNYSLVIDGQFFLVNKEQFYQVEVGDQVFSFVVKGE